MRPMLVLALLALGCEKVKDVDNFDVDVTDRLVVEGASPVDDLLGEVPEVAAFTRLNLSESADFQNEKYDPDDVDSVVLESLVLRVVEPGDQDLSFFGEVVFFLEADGLPRKEIARATDFEGLREVAFETTGDDLKDYVLAKEGRVTAVVRDSRRPAEDTTLEMEAVFDVDVDVL
jgi:hypothetical protein